MLRIRHVVGISVWFRRGKYSPHSQLVDLRVLWVHHNKKQQIQASLSSTCIYLNCHLGQEDDCKDVVGECQENPFLRERKWETMFYRLLCAAVHPPVHIWVVEKTALPILCWNKPWTVCLQRGQKSKYLHNNTLWFSPASTRLCVSTMDRDSRQHLPPNPPVCLQILPNFPQITLPPQRKQGDVPPWDVLDKSLPASHLQTSLHRVNITELPILLEIQY